MSATVVHTRRAAKPNGWWGAAVFLASEATLIGTLVGSYFYLRFNTAPWPPHGTPEPRVVAPLILTLVLVAAGGGVYAALWAARRGRRFAALGALAFATSVQGVYLALQIALMRSDLHRYSPRTSAYSSIYYTLSGAAHAHVAVGLLIDLWLLARIANRLTPYRLIGLRVATMYWSVVSVLAVVVFLTQVSPKL
jgi:heme/copper-type cytochrome/quinol oxidase subunit 3